MPANETVGYSRKGKLTRDSRTATIPVGYADGLNRKLGNGVGKVMINGKIAPIIGNICMDCVMVDITGIDAKAGDTVEIFGDNISIEKMAESKILIYLPYLVQLLQQHLHMRVGF